ncbi:PREDICTED: TOM1-like protein 1 isoform X1 [Galeopterus variegatus]|uniref:TOM1-like protein 1 isoform X1 n=2 Tax=Galeopterus variegatus TaxID=482537 RepID=A0ABM0RRX5_GALVR|nr:PREDICTED: TOM1-like protein 1 isoform X1 [Galeopterus variegatus]XP_008583367.1 PREDICTED: TOM1-like protein 1 isoform X1 [Galeopterus variegatus]
MAFGKSHRDPYATSVGHLIEKATFAGVQTEDWGQFMHICDIINTARDGPKDAVKALKKRISKNYNHTEIQLTLSLIDMCMQNCGPSFQSLVVKKEFVKDSLVKLLNPRYTLPLHIQNRILNFIKTWSQGFPGGVDISEVKEVYLDLLKKGVQFPSSDAEAEAETVRQETAQISSNPPASVPTAPALPSVIVPKNSTITLVPEQIGKLHSELDMVKMNVKVMFTILMENAPGSENHEDIELLQKLYKTGRDMQERIMDLLVVVENEDVTVELLQVNEDLNNAILGYERFTRNHQRYLEENKNQKEATSTTSEPSAPSHDLLYLNPSPPMTRATLGEHSPMNDQLSDLNFNSSNPDVTNNSKPSLYPQMDLLNLENTEIPMFAQRTSQNLASGHTYDNFPEHSNPVLLQPVSLQTVAATPANQRLPSLPSNHPAMTKNDLQSHNYYEVMEFDPLAPAVIAEAIYEEIDVHHHKETKSHSDC